IASDRPLDASLVDPTRCVGTARCAWLAIGDARVDPSIALPRTLEGALLRGIRHDAERLVFDVADGVEISSFVLGSPSRWVLDFRPAAASSRLEAGRGVHVILLDPGHGGHGEGAAVGGLREADLVLDIARRVSEALVRRLP